MDIYNRWRYTQHSKGIPLLKLICSHGWKGLCTSELNADTSIQTLSSAGYPINYPSNGQYNCTYTVTASPGKIINFIFNGKVLFDSKSSSLNVRMRSKQWFDYQLIVKFHWLYWCPDLWRIQIDHSSFFRSGKRHNQHIFQFKQCFYGGI